MLAALTAIIKAGDNTVLLLLGSVSLGFALFNVIEGFLVTDRMLAMFSRSLLQGERDVDLLNARRAGAVLLLLGIEFSKVRSARGANQLAAVAMALAVLGLLINYLGTSGISMAAWTWIIAGTLVGGVLGAITAQRVPMTSMPETVALFNGCGGMSSLLVALAAALTRRPSMRQALWPWCRSLSPCSLVQSPSPAQSWPWPSCRAGCPRLPGCRARRAMP